MIEALLVVLTNPVEGRDADFNDWYSNIHTRDALRCWGSIAQQRFSLAKEQAQDYPNGFRAKYLALYEVYDAALFTQEHVDRALTTRLMVEDSINNDRIDDFHYYPLQYRDRAPRSFSQGSVVMEQIVVKPGQADVFRDWYNDVYLPERFRDTRIISGAFLAFEPYGQMLRRAPDHDHVAIWRLSDDGARDLWRQSTALLDCPHIDQATLAVTCWDILTPRLTENDVCNPTSEGLAAEENARARIKRQGTEVFGPGRPLIIGGIP